MKHVDMADALRQIEEYCERVGDRELILKTKIFPLPLKNLSSYETEMLESRMVNHYFDMLERTKAEETEIAQEEEDEETS